MPGPTASNRSPSAFRSAAGGGGQLRAATPAAPRIMLRLCWAGAALCLAARMQADWRAGAYLGAALTHATSVLIEQPSRNTRLEFRRVRFEDRSFEPPVYYGYRLGYFFGKLGIEAEFIHQKVYARTERVVEVRGVWRGAETSGRLPMNALVEQFSISHGLNMLLVNAVLEKALSRRAFLDFRLGAGPTIPHPESCILGECRQQYELGRPAWQAAAAMEFQLWRGLHWLTEYKFTHTRQRVTIPAGSGETSLRSHHGVFGLSLRF